MPNNWLDFMYLDGGSPDIFPMEAFVSSGLGAHLFSQFSSFVDTTLYHSTQLYVPGSVSFREAFSCISKFTGVVLFCFSSMSTSKLSRDVSSSGNNQHGLKSGSCKSSAIVKHIASCKNNITGFCFASDSRGLYAAPLVIGKISSYAMRNFFGKAEALQHIPLLSLAAALIPPLDNLSSKVLAVPLDNTEVQMPECMGRWPCEIGQGCSSLSFLDLNRIRHAVEPRTGIEFPTILNNILDTQNNSSLASELLVGTGSKTMKIIKFKSLKIYAFGFYIHPYSVCRKLGAKYASIPVGELNKHKDFYQDLLREDIGMTVRLVVNCNGMKVNTVRDAFEKSLRARLAKTNPNTDYSCLSTFGSYFIQDIPIPAGTIIDFQRTTDGRLITKNKFLSCSVYPFSHNNNFSETNISGCFLNELKQMIRLIENQYFVSENYGTNFTCLMAKEIFLQSVVTRLELSTARICAGLSLTCTSEIYQCPSKQKKTSAET